MDKTAAYIDYLKNMHNLEISVHLTDKYSYILYCGGAGELIKYNTHTNPYCFHVKSDRIMHRKCLKCQWMAIRKCAKSESYTGVCHAGVRQYICGIYANGEAAGFVSVSGYADKSAPPSEDKWYNGNMRYSDIPVKLLDAVIPPLCVMLENLIVRTPPNAAEDNAYLRILSYLGEHHNSVTVDELCAKFNYSKSYISHMFRKKSGYTLKHYCNLLKIRDAKLLLEQTQMSVTDIAFSAGFNSFSYFINTFKNIAGETPLAWRKRTAYTAERKQP